VPEAEAALAGGASLIDVKEPARGSLGPADPALVAAVVRWVAGRRPVSAALGELGEAAAAPDVDGLSFVKCGLAACGAAWKQELAAAAGRWRQAMPGSGAVAAAYADWQRAESPPPDMIVDFAVDHGWEVVLFDTWRKDGTTLLDWLSLAEVARLCRRCREAEVRVALAGSLGFEQITKLRVVNPDWFAVRGAVCRDGRRDADVEVSSVRRLVELLGGPVTAATPES
jgi:hypothetical protein